MANPNPSPATRFGVGNKANPQGKTSSHRKAEIKAAELAAKIQLELLEALDETFASAGSAHKVDQIRNEVLKLLKDSQDRAFGAPTQPVDNTSSDGSMSPTTVKIVAVKPDE